jgi:hypothetical protein
VIDLQRQDIRSRDRIASNGYLSARDYARLLTHLLGTAEAYLGILEWQSILGALRNRRQKAIVDANIPLVAKTPEGDFDLLIPNWCQLKTFYLLVFHNDGSILWAQLRSQGSLEAIRGGPESEAARKVLNAKGALGPAKRKFMLRSGGGVIILYALLLALFAVPSSLAWRIFAGLSLSVTVVGLTIAAARSPGALRPRENWLGLSWRFLEWNKADVRNLLIAASLFVAGLLIGSR